MDNKNDRIQENQPTVSDIAKISDHEKYILVLDLDETLVHFKENGRIGMTDNEKLKVRPGVAQFL